MASPTLTNWFDNKTVIKPVQNPNVGAVTATGALAKPAVSVIKPVTANTPVIKQQAAQTQQQAIIDNQKTADAKLKAANDATAKAKAFNATGTYTASTVDPKLLGEQAQWNVGAKETVQGQAADIISKDSPLMQLARRQAMEQSGARGMLNSSAGIGASMDAVVGRALEIANPDAATFSRAHGYNVDTANTFNKTNTEAINQARTINAGAKNTASQFGAGNQFTRQQGEIQQGYTKENKGIDQKYNLETMTAEQKNNLETLAKQQGYSLETMSVQQRDDLIDRAIDQGYNLETLGVQQKYAKETKAIDQDNTKELAAIQQGYSVDNTKLDFKNSLAMAATNQGYTLVQKDVDAANEIARDATLNGYQVNMTKLTNNFTKERDVFAAKVQKDLQDDTQKFTTSERTATEKFTANQKIVDGNIASGLETLKHEYNLTENQQGIVGELAKGMGTYIMNIQTNPDMKQETKDFLINQGWGDFKASVKMISNVGKIPDVGELLKVD